MNPLRSIANLFRGAPAMRASVTYEQRDLTAFIRDVCRKTASGEVVTPERAFALSSYFAAIRNGSEDVAKLPRQVRQKVEGRRGSVLVDHPIVAVLRRPNPLMSWQAFASCMQARKMGYGNAYAEIVLDPASGGLHLWPIHPIRVTVDTDTENRSIVYKVDGRANPIPPNRMFHLKGLGDGLVGMSVVAYASESIGVALAAQRHSAAFFGEGLAKKLVAFVKQTIGPEAREALRKRMQGDSEANPVGSRKMPIVDVEADIREVGISPVDAQLLESREFSVEDVARWFRMPLSKIGYHKRAQGWSTLDTLNTDYVVDFLSPHVQTWEEEIDAKLLRPEDREQGVFVRFVVQGLMRGNVDARIKYYAAGLKDGWLSQNDVRDLEDLDEIEDEGADEYRVQAQMVKISERENEGGDDATSGDAA